MHVEFHGAAGEVTGSCFLVEAGGRRVLLDCGLIQGGRDADRRNREPFPFDPAALDAVILGHAHLDHSGRLPLLVASGFRGRIHAHRACRDLCRIMLADSAMLGIRDAEWETRKRARRGLPPVAPLYTVDDVRKTLARFRATGYGERRRAAPGIEYRLLDAGHILGSAIVELWLTEGSRTRKLVYSGDLGLRDAPILRDVTTVAEADHVLIESTYGDRLHRTLPDTLAELGAALRAAARDRGNVLVPAFAVGRAQELIYLFGRHFEEWGLRRWQVFLDSPLAIEATGVYMRHGDLWDEEARARWRGRNLADLLPNLRVTRTPKQSMAINRITSGAIIIAGSGMCEGGRIRHHFKHNLWRSGCHVLFTGYQAAGTLGRRIVDGARYVQLWSESVKVGAAVHTIGGLSAHADQAGLRDWYRGFAPPPPVTLVHGEPRALEALGACLREHGAPSAEPAVPGGRVDLQR